MIHMIREWPNRDVTRFFNIIYSILNPGGVVVVFPLHEARSLGDFSHYDPMALMSGYQSLYMLTSASHTSYPKQGDEIARMLADVGFADATSNTTSNDHFVAAAMPVVHES